VLLPEHLRNLAGVHGELTVDPADPVTQRTLLDAIEGDYPMLKGTLRDQTTQERRKFVRFFALEEDLSHESPDTPLPQPVVNGAEPFIVIGAMSGG
jgi:hypothetical protein